MYEFLLFECYCSIYTDHILQFSWTHCVEQSNWIVTAICFPSIKCFHFFSINHHPPPPLSFHPSFVLCKDKFQAKIVELCIELYLLFPNVHFYYISYLGILAFLLQQLNAAKWREWDIYIYKSSPKLNIQKSKQLALQRNFCFKLKFLQLFIN